MPVSSLRFLMYVPITLGVTLLETNSTFALWRCAWASFHPCTYASMSSSTLLLWTANICFTTVISLLPSHLPTPKEVSMSRDLHSPLSGRHQVDKCVKEASCFLDLQVSALSCGIVGLKSPWWVDTVCLCFLLSLPGFPSFFSWSL